MQQISQKQHTPRKWSFEKNFIIMFLILLQVLLRYQKQDKNFSTLKYNDIIMVIAHNIIFIALDVLCHGAKLNIIRIVPYLEMNGNAEVGTGRLLSRKGGGPQGNYGLTKAHLL